MRKAHPKKLTKEEKTAEYERDAEYREAIQREKEGAKARNVVIQRFRLGAKRICAQSMWAKIEQEVGTGNAIELETTLKIRREEIYTLRRGAMSLDMLIALISHLGWDCEKLDPLPPLQDRAVAGYQMVLYWMKTGKTKPYCDSMAKLFTKISFIINAG